MIGPPSVPIGAQIHPAVRPRASELVFAGMMTHMCVDTTVRAAADLGFVCSLARDACATRDLAFGASKVAAGDVQTAYLAALSGSFAAVRSASEITAGL